jgi:hypothetical protein
VFANLRFEDSPTDSPRGIFGRRRVLIKAMRVGFAVLYFKTEQPILSAFPLQQNPQLKVNVDGY